MERIQRELEQREMEEAMALVKAHKGGKAVKLKVQRRAVDVADDYQIYQINHVQLHVLITIIQTR